MSSEKKDFTCVGHSVTKVDVLDKALGKALYAEDMKFPGLLHGKVLRSPFPHARIKNIDKSKAEAMQGVVCVVTADDLSANNTFGIAFLDQYPLIKDKVRYIGDPVAVLAAESEDIAREALRKIKVSYEELPAVFTPHEGLQEGAPKVHEKGNIVLNHKTIKGDIGEGFKQAAVIVENTYKTHVVDHAYIETESGVGMLDHLGNLVIWSANQAPARQRRQIARGLGLKENRVRVIRSTTGGAFGGKDDITVEMHIAILVLATGRPVRLVLDREESIQSQTTRHAIEIWTKWGATKEGKLCAVEGKVYGNTGAYAGLGPFVVKKCGIHLCGPYYSPNVNVESWSIYTNTPLASAMRGFGVVQAAVAHEAQIDSLAEKLGINPLQFRLMNALENGLSTATGQVFDGGVGIKATLEKLKEVVEQDPSLREMSKEEI